MKRSRESFKTSHRISAIFLLLLIAGCGGGGGVGNRGGDTAPPVLAVTTPAPGSSVSDVDFRSESFYIQISYSDGSPMNFSTFRVSLKMDNGSAQDITSYFSQVDASTIRSNNLYQFTRTLFELAINDITRVMTVTASIDDTATNNGRVVSTFTVYPVGPPPQTP